MGGCAGTGRVPALRGQDPRLQQRDREYHHHYPQQHPLHGHFAADEDREEGSGQDSVRGPDEANLLRTVRGGGGEPQHCLYCLRVTGIRTAERPHHRPRH